MRQSRFTEEQIIGIPREHESGAATAEVWQRYQRADVLSLEGEV